MGKPQLSLGKKLIGLIVALVGLVVLVLTIYFPSQQLALIHEQLVDDARVYASLAAKQLEPAVAFRDRETAREVLDGISQDRDVIAAAAYTEDRAVLYQIGTPVSADLIGVRITRVIESHGAIAVAMPIISPEGPRGTVVIAMSIASANAEQAHVRSTAMVVGLAVLVAGAIAAWLIARSIARRLRRVAVASAAIAAGHLDGPRLGDTGSDEISVLSQAFDAMAASMQQVNHDLERRIAERTAELHASNARLQAQLAQQALIEVELRQAQKLEAVGRLAAGVAHELNTPIQFVSDSCSFLHEATTDVLGMIARAGTIVGDVRDGRLDPAAGADAFAREADAISLDYLARRVPSATQRALDGLGRIASIVRSMKEFSHPSHDKGPADVRRGLEATLEIARNEYKYVADVVTEFAPLPAVVCQIGELNQVFLNIIVNAAHAIQDVVHDGERGTIRVRTWLDGDVVKIAIADTGGGIPDSIRDKIFDPFFTTKEVGKGTGQGLAIARAVIVDRHHGHIDVTSERGRGTTFTIAIPLDGNPQRAAA